MLKANEGQDDQPPFWSLAATTIGQILDLHAQRGSEPIEGFLPEPEVLPRAISP